MKSSTRCHYVLHVILVLITIGLCVFLYLYWKRINPTLPHFKYLPEVDRFTNSSIWIGWTDDYVGDGPVCGYIVHLKFPSSPKWSDVGFVAVDKEVHDPEFLIDRLDADTRYGIGVTVLHCSGREGEMSPEIDQRTKDYVRLYSCENPIDPMDPTLPRLSKQLEIKNATTSAIEIEWEGDYDGDGPVCGYIVSLKSPSSPSWSNVGFESISEEKNVYTYTIDRLDADTLYDIGVTILHCSGKHGGKSQEISQSTKDYGPGKEISFVPTSSSLSRLENCPEFPTDKPYDGHFWKLWFIIVVPILSSIVLLQLIVFWFCKCRWSESAQAAVYYKRLSHFITEQ